MDVANLDEARRALAIRELGDGDHTEDEIQRFIRNSIGYWVSENRRGQCADEIGRWASGIGLDAVVWTDLRPKFQRENRVPTENEVLSFLLRLRTEKRSQNAEEYIRKAPHQIDTDYRGCIEAELKWTPIGDI
jgi:hypothetical protein